MLFNRLSFSSQSVPVSNPAGPVRQFRPLVCSHQWQQGALVQVQNLQKSDDPKDDLFLLSVPKLPEDSPLRKQLAEHPDAVKLSVSKMPHEWVILPPQIAKLLPHPAH